MEILGIGMPELVFILIIALLVLGPKDMDKTAKTVGKWLNSVIHSDGWKTMRNVTNEIRTLPTRLMREANIDSYSQNRPASPSNPEPDSASNPLSRSQPYSSEPAPGKFPENQIAPSAEQKQKESTNGNPDNA
jgi:Sec-independent protein translocase protein TatA